MATSGHYLQFNLQCSLPTGRPPRFLCSRLKDRCCSRVKESRHCSRDMGKPPWLESEHLRKSDHLRLAPGHFVPQRQVAGTSDCPHPVRPLLAINVRGNFSPRTQRSLFLITCNRPFGDASSSGRRGWRNLRSFLELCCYSGWFSSSPCSRCPLLCKLSSPLLSRTDKCDFQQVEFPVCAFNYQQLPCYHRGGDCSPPDLGQYRSKNQSKCNNSILFRILSLPHQHRCRLRSGSIHRKEPSTILHGMPLPSTQTRAVNCLIPH